MASTEFETWVQQVGPALHRTGYLLTGDWAQSQELVVQACAEVRTGWDALGAPEAHARALVARRAAALGRRPGSSRPPHEGLAALLGQDGGARPDRRTLLVSTLEALPPRERTVLVLQYYDGLTEEQVARDLGWPADEVHDLTDRALDALRARGLDDGWELG